MAAKECVLSTFFAKLPILRVHDEARNKECVPFSVWKHQREGCFCFYSVCVSWVGGIKGCQNLTAQPPVHSFPRSISLSFTVKISLRQAKVKDQAAAGSANWTNCHRAHSHRRHNVAEPQRTHNIPYPLAAELLSWQSYSNPLFWCWFNAVLVSFRKKQKSVLV